MPAPAFTVRLDRVDSRQGAQWADLVARLDRHRSPGVWPTAAQADRSAGRLPAAARQVYSSRDGRFAGIAEGRVYRVEIGTGALGLRVFDPNRYERRGSLNPDLPLGAPPPAGGLGERFDAYDRRAAADIGPLADAAAVLEAAGLSPVWHPPLVFRPSLSAVLGRHARTAAAVASLTPRVDILRRPARSSVIREWSRRSRTRMLRTFAELDYAPLFSRPGTPAMVTLTYPGAWFSLAPDGKTVKAHLRAWVERFFRTFGYRPPLLWKLEFQRRGAPHLHLFLSVPAFTPTGSTFRSWLSHSWAAVVGAQGDDYAAHLRAGTNVDFGRASRVTDPRRIAGYFLKHGTKTQDDKEYQHFVPQLWLDSGATPGRFWGFQGLEKVRAVVDLDLDDFVVVRRTLRRHARANGRRRCYVGGRVTGGWSLASSGPAFADQLARMLAMRRATGYYGRSPLLTTGEVGGIAPPLP